jgi:hypothetical protein
MHLFIIISLLRVEVYKITKKTHNLDDDNVHVDTLRLRLWTAATNGLIHATTASFQDLSNLSFIISLPYNAV